eukprot:TRINITY_DN1987_c0_g1_i13.p1 TRINITY_DN1987_c0_g1~~TRINITY_DN1987_c0_g1_i13.p1  ORF type:complete len:296 (-),score=35.80 TRINITY_DN1987_c0_g1_i13:373-1260(-)
MWNQIIRPFCKFLSSGNDTTQEVVSNQDYLEQKREWLRQYRRQHNNKELIRISWRLYKQEVLRDQLIPKRSKSLEERRDSYRKYNSSPNRLFIKKNYLQRNKERLRLFRQNAKVELQQQRNERRRDILENLACLADTRNKLEAALSISEPTDWYNLTTTSSANLTSIPGGKIFYYINLFEFLKISYPQMEWKVEKFKNLRRSYTWSDPVTVREYLRSIELSVGVEIMEDWYWVSKKQMERVEGGKQFLFYFKSVASGLSFAFPSFPWSIDGFKIFHKKSSQRWLMKLIKQIFLFQ